jgi:hypothetical protein
MSTSKARLVVLRSPSGRYLKDWSMMGFAYGTRDEAARVAERDAKYLRGWLPDGPDLIVEDADDDGGAVKG